MLQGAHWNGNPLPCCRWVRELDDAQKAGPQGAKAQMFGSQICFQKTHQQVLQYTTTMIIYIHVYIYICIYIYIVYIYIYIYYMYIICIYIYICVCAFVYKYMYIYIMFDIWLPIFLGQISNTWYKPTLLSRGETLGIHTCFESTATGGHAQAILGLRRWAQCVPVLGWSQTTQFQVETWNDTTK